MSQDTTEPMDDSILNKLNQIITIIQSLDSRVQGVEARISALEIKVEERLYDTRPIWERVLTEIAELRAGQEQLRDTMWEGFHKVERRLMFLNKDFLDRRAEVSYLEDRIEKLESERA